MPTYDFYCRPCGVSTTFRVPVDERDSQTCPYCKGALERGVAAPLFKFTGRVTPGGGPDRFTADMLGIPLKELPDGLKVDSK